MSNRRAVVLFLAVWTLTACNGDRAVGENVIGAPMHASATAVPGSVGGIQALVTTYMNAWEAKDATAFASIYATDVRFLNPIGGILLGREAIRAQHVFLFSGPFAGSSAAVTIADMRFLTGTIAIVYQDVALSGFVALPPPLQPTEPGVLRLRHTWVVQKRGAQWEVVFQQGTAIPPAP